MLMDFGGRVHLGFPSAQLNDSLLSFLKILYLRVLLVFDLHYCFLLTYSSIIMDGNQLLFMVR